jgi:hypothetical protein
MKCGAPFDSFDCAHDKFAQGDADILLNRKGETK